MIMKHDASKSDQKEKYITFLVHIHDMNGEIIFKVTF